MPPSNPRRRRRASLTFPAMVRLVSRPAPDHPLRRRVQIVPEWLVRAACLVGGSPVPTLLTHTGISIGEGLDVLVIPPPGCQGFSCGYVIGSERIRCECTWYPVVQVGPERHDPTRGHYSPELHTTIRFERTPDVADRQ